ncbi:hypothetical protein F4808DRAFT_286763 [Astrocystis sublimbata]|nr:hypothetical protein F4808DRAFT_286763 [Astrocystis sublimbata]
MRSTAVLAMAGAAAALPSIPFTTFGTTLPVSKPHTLVSRQNGGLCSVVGNNQLPDSVQDIANNLASSIQCDNNAQTISGVPDVSSSGLKFSDIDFSTSGQSPLEFAINTFVQADNLADSNLAAFEAARDVYLATEAGIRSVGGDLSIRAPKFFLEMQVSRIQTAQGNPPSDAGSQVAHLAENVIKFSGTADKQFENQINELASST